MKIVNAKTFSILYTLNKLITTKLDEMKKDINEGAKITFEKYANIQIVPCTRTTLDKTKVQEVCDKYSIDITTLQKTTNYKRIDVDNINEEATEKANNILTTLEADADKNIAKAASGVKNTTK